MEAVNCIATGLSLSSWIHIDVVDVGEMEDQRSSNLGSS